MFVFVCLRVQPFVLKKLSEYCANGSNRLGHDVPLVLVTLLSMFCLFVCFSSEKVADFITWREKRDEHRIAEQKRKKNWGRHNTTQLLVLSRQQTKHYFSRVCEWFFYKFFFIVIHHVTGKS